MAKKLIGTVVSDIQSKTIVVKTERRVTHPLYHKQYTVSKKYQVHDEKNEAILGDKVSIVEVRPLSKTKSWQLKAIVERKESAAEEVVA